MRVYLNVICCEYYIHVREGKKNSQDLIETKLKVRGSALQNGTS